MAIEWDYDAMSGRQVKSVPILPSSKAVDQGYYIPFARPLFLYVNVKSLEKPYVKDFLNFFVEDARTYVRKVNCLPLPEIAYRGAIADIDKRRTGTRFDGEPAVGIAMRRSFDPPAAIGLPVHRSRATFRATPRTSGERLRCRLPRRFSRFI